MKVTVADVIDSEKLRREVEEIERAHDAWLYRFLSERGSPIPKSLWRRMKKRVLNTRDGG